jgi:hypothetical protein
MRIAATGLFVLSTPIDINLKTMQYKVIPFVGSLDQDKKSSSQHVAEQLEEVISNYTAKGWTYVRLESVTTEVAPDSGCFGVIGTKPGYTTSRQLIVFEKE